jgi:hypothetical protein
VWLCDDCRHAHRLLFGDEFERVSGHDAAEGWGAEQ